MSLRAEHLETFYGPVQALHGVSVEVGQGEVVAVLGRNGMGKTTLVHSISGLLRPTRGTIELDGQAIHGLNPEQILRRGVALMPQGHRVFPSLTVAENLSVAARPGPWTEQSIGEYLPKLGERRKQMARTLSGGEQQMLTMGRALVMNAPYLLLDEPVEGLAPSIAERFGDIIRELRTQGAGVLLVEQRLRFALDLADRVVVMSRGIEVFEGTPAELRANDEVRSTHLSL